MSGACGHSLCLDCCSNLEEGECPFCKRAGSFSNAVPNYLATSDKFYSFSDMLTDKRTPTALESNDGISGMIIEQTTRGRQVGTIGGWVGITGGRGVETSGGRKFETMARKGEKTTGKKTVSNRIQYLYILWRNMSAEPYPIDCD